MTSLRGNKEIMTTPCVNEFESKGQTISTEGVDGLIPKHLVTVSDR